MTGRFDFLVEPLLSIQSIQGNQHVSLPDVLAMLGKEEVRGFLGLQAHQHHAWHSFLVQLAALALHANGETKAVQPAQVWRDWLLALVDGKASAWCLVVPELREPALFQPPLGKGEGTDDWKGPKATPDDLDLLVAAKNHDVKQSRLAHPAPEHWFYALLALQTMQGFLGPGNYGIARMNGGFSNRPGVGVSDGLSLGKRFVQDVGLLLPARAGLVDRTGFADDDGAGLLWVPAWDGTAAFSPEQLDPFFIEICRRVRLSQDEEGRVVAWTKPTAGVRVSIDAGLTGDAWTPITEKDTSLTVSASGFDYKLLSRLLFSKDFKSPAALEFKTKRAEPLFRGVALVRGQGKTEGLHSRSISLKVPAVLDLDRAEDRDALGQESELRIELTALMRNKVLKPPLLVLVQGAPAKLDFKDKHADRWTEALDQAVDDVFFLALFSTWTLPPVDRLQSWKNQLVALGREQLRAAMETVPMASSRRWKAKQQAHDLFEALLRKHEFLNPKPKEALHGSTPAP